MEKIKVIFRRSFNRYTGCWETEAFFPEFSANYGKIQCYSIIDGWMEACTEYYQNTWASLPEYYAELLGKLRKEFEGEYELVVRKRINWNDLRNKAWRR